MPKSRLAILLVLGVLLGCGSAERPIAIRGKVTFQGQAVSEGTVQFSDPKTGHGAEMELAPDGSYQATLPRGAYSVAILPPLLMVSKGGPVDPQFKKVRNIPQKYRSTATSGLTADVSSDKTVHDFDMRP
jgi:hypothetical protein